MSTIVATYSHRPAWHRGPRGGGDPRSGGSILVGPGGDACRATQPSDAAGDMAGSTQFRLLCVPVRTMPRSEPPHGPTDGRPDWPRSEIPAGSGRRAKPQHCGDELPHQRASLILLAPTHPARRSHARIYFLESTIRLVITHGSRWFAPLPPGFPTAPSQPICNEPAPSLHPYLGRMRHSQCHDLLLWSLRAGRPQQKG